MRGLLEDEQPMQAAMAMYSWLRNHGEVRATVQVPLIPWQTHVVSCLWEPGGAHTGMTEKLGGFAGVTCSAHLDGKL